MDNLLALDIRLSSKLRLAENSGGLRRLAILFAHSGDSWFWFGGLGLLWYFGVDIWKQRAVSMMIAILLTALIVMIIKFSVRRRRPEGEWGSIYRITDPHSFPSGHAARAAMLAVMALGLGPTWFGIMLLVWAPLVIVARVAMGVHYLSDVIAGAVLGMIIGIVMLNLLPALI